MNQQTLASAYADITCRGQVVDAADNTPLIGATVSIEGDSNRRTATDINGNFAINAPEGGKLTILYIGYKQTTVTAAANLGVIKMSEDDRLFGKQEEAEIQKADTKKAHLLELVGKADELWDEEKFESAVQLYEEAKEYSYEFPTEDAYIDYILGLSYFYGMGVDTDTEKAVLYIKSAAYRGDMQAMWFLGRLFLDGNHGVKKSVSMAEEWIRKSAEKGYKPAIEDLEVRGFCANFK